MKKKVSPLLALGVAMVLSATSESKAVSPEAEQLLQLFETKGIISSQEANEFRRTLEKSEPQPDEEVHTHRHSVQSLDHRVEKLEKAREKISELSERIHFSGFVEVELSAEQNKDGGGSEDSTSSVALATAELDVDVDIAVNVFGHVAFLYEDGEDFTVDEGIISITGGEKLPVFFWAGKMYIPFGRYESHFVSDPATLTLGETNDGALLAGYANNIFEVSAGVFNGAVNETDEDDSLDSFVGSLVYAMPKTSDFALSAGISYTSNLASSDTLRDDASGEGVSSPEINDLVSGFGAFISASFQERFFFDAEYVSAEDEFSAGDLAFDGGMALQPSAWNFELAYAFNSQLEFAARYGGSDEFGSVVPQDQYGLALLYSPFDNISIISEYLYSEFEDGSDVNAGTIQLAIVF